MAETASTPAAIVAPAAAITPEDPADAGTAEFVEVEDQSTDGDSSYGDET